MYLHVTSTAVPFICFWGSHAGADGEHRSSMRYECDYATICTAAPSEFLLNPDYAIELRDEA